MSKTTKTDKQNKEIAVKEDERSWFHKLWKSQEQINKDAKNYNSIPWYFAPRYGAIALLLIQNFVGFITGLFGWGDFFLVTAVYLPLYFLIARGYRLFIGLALVLYTINKFYNVVVLDYTSVAELFWWLATVYMLVVAYRIEDAKAKLVKDKKTTYIRDALVVILIFGGFLAAALWLSFKTSYANDEVMYWKGFVYRNTDGIKNYCSDVGIDLNNYANSFNEQYNNEITYINNKITEIGLNPDTMFEDMNVPTGEVNQLVANHYDALHMILTSFLVIEQTGMNPDDFEWKDEYKDLLSKAGFCSFVDINPGLIQVIDNDFELFPVRIELLKAEQ